MHKHYEFKAWENEKFNQVFNLFEEDDPSTGGFLNDSKDEGLDRSEFVKLIKRMAQL
jgi:hypothetical protein